MSDSVDKMVLRTVYLPRDLDEQLRLIAFRQGKTKNDIIRNAVKLALEGRPPAVPSPLKAKGKAAAPLKKSTGERAKQRTMAKKAAAKVS